MAQSYQAVTVTRAPDALILGKDMIPAPVLTQLDHELTFDLLTEPLAVAAWRNPVTGDEVVFVGVSQVVAAARAGIEEIELLLYVDDSAVTGADAGT